MGEGGLAGAGGADENDEGEVGDGEDASLGLLLRIGHAAFASFSVAFLSVAFCCTNMAI